MNSIATLGDAIENFYAENRNVRILHFNAADNLVKKELAERGFWNYLGISFESPDRSCESELFYTKDKNVLVKNNADILILSRCGVYDVKNAFNSSAQFIVCQPDSLLKSFSSFAVWAYKYARRMKWEVQMGSFADKDKKGNPVIIFKREFKKEKKARYYLSPETGYQNFFDAVNELQLQYVVLRWHDKIPFSDLSEDVDLLISDRDIEKVQNLMNERVGILPFDLYSLSGLPGSTFKNIAYYPPYLGEQILQDRELWEGKYYIPNKKNYFYSLMYHAVYHKGEKSGIPVHEGDQPNKDLSDHEYLEILQKLAGENNIKLEKLNLLYFHELLEKAGWAPATDTLRKLSEGNATWLNSIIKETGNNFEKDGELMVFIIREWAYERGLTGLIVGWFEKSGLNLVKSVELKPEQREKAAQNLRGGNWDKGPWPISGGKPAVMLVMYDYHPKALEGDKRKKYPHVSNEHYLFKEEIRLKINSSLPDMEKTNPIHSSDDEIEALDYINSISPEIIDEVQETVTEWDRLYKTKEKVIKDVSQYKRRAKVEIIEYNGTKAVKKTYKAGKERFLEREKYVYGELSKECRFIPALLESGENYIIIPFLKTTLLSRTKYFKMQALKKYKHEILSISEFFYNKGYALIDFHPGNILVTKEGPRIIDFEFLYKYKNKPENIQASFDFAGYPDNFVEDVPYGIDIERRKDIWKEILY
ncbi:hypothetical protein [Planococcus salinarum]|uniref:hypothetical protein n=1 Tax=Planococcus salinarum TaxID=622695 RepID=UPI000E3CD698|nr:hypothetical protein [Planococcus salinarum]TAA72293.1 hypothetical protein D2909_06910 [Planococcus salinarum]